MNSGEALSKKWRKVAENETKPLVVLQMLRRAEIRKKLIKSWHRSRTWV